MPDINILIQHDQWSLLAEDDLMHMAQTVIVAEPAFPPDAEFSIVLTDDVQVQELNKTYRGQDKPTNVLTFPAYDGEKPKINTVELGDILLAYETIAKEAQDGNKTLRDHTAHLLVHGMLHLLGYTHEQERDASVMEDRERTILATLNITDPYL